MEVRAGDVRIGPGRPLVLIAGPCVLEGVSAAVELAAAVRDVARRHGVPFVFKASFDKANRTSIHAFRGPGLEAGLRTLARVRQEVGVPVTTDVHQPDQAAPAAEVVDLLQVPAFLCRQTDLLLACAATGRPVNVKKGQFMAPAAMGPVVEKLRSGGAREVLLTERGTAFGHGDLVVDFRGLPTLRALGVPVCFDCTHAVQRPPAGGAATGGEGALAPVLARAAVAVGVDAVFAEVHPLPEASPSDGANMLDLAGLDAMLGQLVALRAVLEPAP